LKPYFTDLQEREINSVAELEKWLIDYSELTAVISENMAWRYIKMTCDTANTTLREAFNDFVQNIEPNILLTKR
jgi:oligoendopeptidase F